MTHPDLPGLVPFVLAQPEVLSGLPQQVWDLGVHHVSASSPDTQPFREALMRLDGLTFGPEGMPMAPWLFEDTAFLPGLVSGFALPLPQLTEGQLQRLSLASRALAPELVPVSMYIAIASQQDGVFGHNLASLANLLPELGLKRLGTLTKVLGLAIAQVSTVSGITQWQSHALGLHAKFGPLWLQSAWTPLHSFPATLVYRVPLAPTDLEALWQGHSIARPQPNRWIDPKSEDSLKALQHQLEQGREVAVLAGPKDGLIPLYEKANHQGLR